MTVTGQGIEAVIYPRPPADKYVNVIKILPDPSEASYGISVPSTTSASSICFADKGASGGPPCSVTEQTPLNNSQKVLSFAAKAFKNISSELEKAKRALVTTEKDIEQGVAGDAFSVFSVTVRKPLTPPKLAALGYSYLPFVFFVFILIDAVVTWKALPLYAAVVQVSLTLLNEHVFKRIYPDPRPALSLSRSPGMPSSHCVVSYAFLFWFSFEAIVSDSPFIPRLLFVCLSVAAFAPMPWARTYLHDHSEMQCLVGCLGGALWGIFLFVVRRICFPAAAVI